MRILIVKLSALGDVVQTLPSLTLIKKTLPSAKIDWVVDKRNAEVLEGHPYIKRLIIFSKDYIRLSLKLINFLKELREKHYDVVIDYQGLLKSGLITGFSRAKYRAGFRNHREGSPFFYNLKLPPYDQDMHAVKRYLLLTKEVLKFLGVPCDYNKENIPEVLWNKEIYFTTFEFIQKPYLIFVPSARWKTKLWPFSYWEKLIEICGELSKEYDIFITGSPTDSELKIWAESWEKNFNYVKSLVGKLRIKELVSFIKGAKLIVTVDTGPMHIASALKVPTVALFGPTSPERTGPWGERDIILKSEVSCSPCFKKKCRDLKCMKNIKPEEVKKTIKKLII